MAGRNRRPSSVTSLRVTGGGGGGIKDFAGGAEEGTSVAIATVEIEGKVKSAPVASLSISVAATGLCLPFGASTSLGCG